MNSMDKILATAEQYGWRDEYSAAHHVLTRLVPMCDQRDEYRLVVEFAINGRLSEAFYGPDRRPHDLNSAADVVGHLIKWASQ